MKRLGIDIGGTFTDLVLHRECLTDVWSHKVLTTPEDPAKGVVQGVMELLADAGVSPTEIGDVIYATTVATNAVLERKGAPTVLFTTLGFRDVLLLQRQARYDIFDLFIDKPAPLLRRRDIYEIAERITADGRETAPLDERSLRELTTKLAAEGVRSVAIAFLHAYRHDAHEQRAAEIVKETAPDCHVSLSCVVAPVIGEYERVNTTVVDAYVRPVTIDHLEDLERRLRENGIAADLQVMLSDGAVTSVARAVAVPVRMIESGPAAGAKMGAFVGKTANEPRVVAFDMGGTTAKVALIENGRPTMSDALEIDRVGIATGSGLPLAIPSVDLLEIGSGGGSIANVNGAVIAVGPGSAGANPGPASYGKGGTHATVTDANLVLGYLSPDYFLGGRLKLDVALARSALQRHVADPLGVSVEDAAGGVYEVVSSNMADAIRAGLIQRGLDPRDYPLVATGGAAPMHAAALARSLGIPQVICPSDSGVASAFGLLAAEHGTRSTRTSLAAVDDRFGDCAESEFGRLIADARAQFGRTRAADQMTFRRAVGVRFQGQGYHVKVALPATGRIEPDQLAEAFYQQYERLYGPASRGPLEATTWYLDVIVETPELTSRDATHPLHASDGGGAPCPHGGREVYDLPARRWLQASVWRQSELQPGARILGPAIIEQDESTVVAFQGDAVSLDHHGNLTITLDPVREG